MKIDFFCVKIIKYIAYPLHGCAASGLKHVMNIIMYVKDQHGYVWAREAGSGAYRRLFDKFRIEDLETYQHSIHSVEARKNLKKTRRSDRDRRTAC